MKSKKAMELSLITLATAVLILVVVVVVITFFTESSKKFSRTINSCEQNGGECIYLRECENTQLNFECTKPKVCCTQSIGLV